MGSSSSTEANAKKTNDPSISTQANLPPTASQNAPPSSTQSGGKSRKKKQHRRLRHKHTKKSRRN